MGNTTVTPEASSQILNKYWQPIGSAKYRNKATQEIIIQKKITFTTQEEMKYVFNCLLKRMNNYNSNVIKIVYLRKLLQTNSLCNCGNKFTILVYIENVELRLKDFINSQQILTDKNQITPLALYEPKCICLHLLKGAEYLKERYGPFQLNENNCWIQKPKRVHQLTKGKHQQLSIKSYNEHAYNFKVKLWISSSQEQNFPDESCQEDKMCLSILQLIQNILIPNKLCKCYTFPQMPEKYLTVSRLKDLVQMIKRDHQSQKELNRLIKPLQNSQILKKQPQFQRTIRSFSSNQPGHHPTYYPHTNHQQIHEGSYHPAYSRKYTSIEYVRKPIDQHSVATDKKAPRNPLILSDATHFISQPLNPHTNQQQPKHSSFQLIRHHQNTFKNDISLQKNQRRLKFNQFEEPLKTQKNHQNFYQNKGNLIFNQKIKHRHGTHMYNRPIIGIADMSSQLNQNKVPIIQMLNIQKASQHKNPQSLFPPNSLPTDRENQTFIESQYEQEVVDVLNINLESGNFRRQGEKSLDNGTNPTDRTKFQVSSKGQSKKQGEPISTSRKNISIIPISLQSTYITGSPLKQELHSQDHLNQPISTPADNNLDAPTQSKSKKQSASSSKSEQNYSTYQINLNHINTKQERYKLIPKKRMSDPQEQSESKSSQRKFQEPLHSREKTHSFIAKIEKLGLATLDGDMGRLRQSEYIISAQNSFNNSKLVSRKQSNDFQEKIDPGKPIVSLALMQAQFLTLHDIQHRKISQIKKSQSHMIKQGYAQERSSLKIQASQRLPQQPQQYQLTNSSKKSSNNSMVFPLPSNTQQKSFTPKVGQLSIGPVLPRHKTSSISSDKVSQLIVQEQQEPLKVPKSNEQEQEANLKVNENSNAQKVHQKQLSTPAFHKNKMAKNKSLKEEFSTLLDFPKDKSFRALTQNKRKILSLDQNQGHQTYSIYNQSEYNTSDRISKGLSQRQIQMAASNPPLPHKQNRKQKGWRKPLGKHETQKVNQSKQTLKIVSQQQNQQMTRLASSGHQDNSIKQKVRNKKAEFAQLKNQMNSLLL